MTISKNEIIKEAQELSESINNSDIFKEYQERSREIANDVEAQNLLQKLYQVGQELSGVETDDSILKSASEKDMVTKELDNNQKVKDFLLAQKQYINLMQQVVENIRNPKVE